MDAKETPQQADGASMELEIVLRLSRLAERVIARKQPARAPEPDPQPAKLRVMRMGEVA